MKLKNPMFGYLGHRNNDEDMRAGYGKIGELPLGFDESELAYFKEHADNDMDEDDVGDSSVSNHGDSEY